MLDFLDLFDLLFDEACEVAVRHGLGRWRVFSTITRVKQDGGLLSQAVFGALRLTVHSLGGLGKLDGGEGRFLWLLVDRRWL